MDGEALPSASSPSCFISIPLIDEKTKLLYKPAQETSLNEDSAFEVDEVIGQYQERGVSYFYARYKGGLAHKFLSETFLQKYSSLVDEFHHKESTGNLEPFDPSAQYIHPLSRVRMIVSIKTRRATVSISSGRSIKSTSEPETIEDSEDESHSGGDDEDGAFEEEEQSPRRRTRRINAKRKQALPFSPRKTRSAKVFVIDSDLETGASEQGATIIPTRRSTRSSARTKTTMGDSDIEINGDDLSYSGDTVSSPRTSRSKARTKKPVQKRESRPAYGHFRSVTDLDYDSLSDDESVTIRKHRGICEKCHQPPAHLQLRALKKRGKAKSKKKKAKDDDDDDEVPIDEEEMLTSLGGWVRCLKCPVVAHWKCIASTQRDEILKAAREKDRAEWERPTQDGETKPEPLKRLSLEQNQTTEFICGACMKGGFCMMCMEVALETDALQRVKTSNVQTVANGAATVGTVENPSSSLPSSRPNLDETLLFRCLTCKRLAHYRHLPPPSHFSSQETAADIVQYYTDTWLCADCASYTFGVDKIIAWRPYPSNATEAVRESHELANYKASLPREYLIKWIDRSFRRVQWVPHMWLLSTNPAKLKNFLAGGSKVELSDTPNATEALKDDGTAFDITNELGDSSIKPQATEPVLSHAAIPDAEHRIPLAWQTVDRILDVLLWRQQSKKQKAKRRQRQRQENIEEEGDSSGDDISQDVMEERELTFEQGEQPSDHLVETIAEWEKRTRQTFSELEIERVAWAFIKWQDLGYDEASWDSPPRQSDTTYPAFKSALRRYVHSRSVTVPKRNLDCTDKRTKDLYRSQHAMKDPSDLHIGQDPKLKLMPFQVDGFNWLCNNWWTLQPCILADEMGLGKTVQVATFLGNIAAKFEAFPALVVVPNSTITNWVREFERWAPNLRVVPFYGEAKAREIIKRYELYHDIKRPGDTGAKFHVLVSTYEALLNQKDFTSVFKNQPRWEAMKSDSSLLFRRLNELKSIHRVIMTGTPLNNNIRELFNLMNFLDPHKWNDLEMLAKEYEDLTEERVKELHNKLRPYFLRRLKSEVLQLPPKNEVIVPVSMAPLQKEVYRSILSHNLELLKGLTSTNTSTKNAPSNGRINNILMQLRKCQWKIAAVKSSTSEIEGAWTSRSSIQSGSGHRLPHDMNADDGQFVIALNVVEDFLSGEGLKYLRLDGNTKGKDRQKGMDEFNKPGSDVFIYLLTTRAGAIARAYRFGQQKTCLVFKLMVKDSAEGDSYLPLVNRCAESLPERIMQVGKRKLVLDHLIVQKMDDDDGAGEDVQSILTYGAQALFESEQSSRDIVYSEQDIEKLVEKTEKEGEEQEQVKENMAFSFARVWAADKDSLEEVEDIDQGDSWAQTLQRITEERDNVRMQEVAQSGRGVKRRAAAVYKPNVYLDDPLHVPSPTRSVKTVRSEGSAYASEVSSPNSDDEVEHDAFEPSQPKMKKSQPSGRLPPSILTAGAPLCGLCGTNHGDGPGECVMTEKSENLAEFREMLILHAEEETWEDRIAAIAAIDRTLFRRGHVHLIIGQPLHPLRHASASTQPNTGMHASSNSNPATSHLPTPSHDTHSDLPTSSATANSSKRPASPVPPERITAKKPKTMADPSSPCPVCQQLPHHLVKNCPLVSDGPQSITKQIIRLEKNVDANSAATVRILRKLLSKEKRKEISGKDGNAPKPKNPNPSGLGRAIINKKVQDARRQQQSGLYTSDVDNSQRLKSVTQERDLDEFLNTAQLAGTEFTAERKNVKVIPQSTVASQNPYLLSEQEERSTLKKQSENRDRLRVPRRPLWTKQMTTEELDKQEKVAFLDWRRGLAQLQEEENFLLTPFERNLEVWRQLWRVLERSQLIVQIVDARNPLRFRCEDLESYVNDVEGPEGESGTGKNIRKNLLLINKSDLLTEQQRRLWADYFDSQGIQYAFFSAANATALQEARREAILSAEAESALSLDEVAHEVSNSDDESSDSQGLEHSDSESGTSPANSDDDAYFSADDDSLVHDPRVKVLSVLELEDWFLSMSPDLSAFSDASGKPPPKLTVGLVGYPNVGKSSTINSLLGEKKVSVSSTPGKTKHFQTIHLSDAIVLCDCPGLVFPQFATTKAELVCDGVLPIDQLREYTGPASLLVQRIPKDVLEAVYGLRIKVSDVEEGGDGKIRAEHLLIAYAIARGYTRSGQGNPDEARAARYILKDYVNGKLLYCRSPPGVPEDVFNEDTHAESLRRAFGKKKAPVTRVGRDADTFIATIDTAPSLTAVLQGQGVKSQALDHDFFESNTTLSSRPFIQSSLRHGEAFSRQKLYPHQNAVADDGTLLKHSQVSGGREVNGKKTHFKTRRTKQRSGKGYD
ncbi:hypothetical protein H0H93_014158 [Arthromyces matolae]|nr:hypothetical protein H0H93_014158 [Arthromyces matolae]